MTNYNHKFKKNLIADWIGRDLSAALRGGVKTNYLPKAFIAASALATSLAFSSTAFAQVVNDGKPIYVHETELSYNNPNEQFEITISDKLNGIDVLEGKLQLDKIHSLIINSAEGNTAQAGININKNSLVTIDSLDKIDLSIDKDSGMVFGVYAENNSSLTLNSGNFISINTSTQTKNNSGINAGDLSSIKITSTGQNNNGWGLNVVSKNLEDTWAIVTAGGDVDVNTTGGGIYLETASTTNTYTVYASDSSQQSGSINLSSSGNISVNATITDSNTTEKIYASGVAAYATFGHKAETVLTGKNIAITTNVNNNRLNGAYGITTQTFSDSATAQSHAQLNADSVSINAQSANPNNAFGIFNASGNVDINTLNLTEIISSGTGIRAMLNSNTPSKQAYVDIDSGSNTISASQYGIRVSGATTVVDLDAKMGSNTITVSNNGRGIYSDSGKVNLTASDNNSLSGKYGIHVANSGTATLISGKNTEIKNASYGIYTQKANVYLDSGENTTIQGNYGIYADGGVLSINSDKSTSFEGGSYGIYGKAGNLTITSGEESIFSGDTGVNLTSNTSLTLTSNESNRFTTKNYALIAQGNASISLTSNNDSNVLSATNSNRTGRGIYSESSVVLDSELDNIIDANIGAQTGNNGGIKFLSGRNTEIYATDWSIYAKSGSVLLNSDKTNLVQAGKISSNSSRNYTYGTGMAIQALSQGKIELYAGDVNAISGAVSSRDTGSSVLFDAKTNTVSSYAVIKNAGNLNNDDKFKDNRVISALYAEGNGAKISLTGEQNYLSTFADSSVHTDLERVVWAYDGADINIDGFTSITTDSYEKSLNSIDIAIAAGTAVNLTDEIVSKPVEDRAQVQINYANTTDSEGKAVLSSVTGDILSAYAGSVNIAPKSTTSDGLVVTGNLLAGNNGELTVDIGANGVLTGRADDYGDAGFIKDSEHTTFFDPAFSSEIFKGGQVNLKLGDNARWNVTGQSWITDISVADGAKNVLIDLVNANTDRNSTAHALTVYNLKGNATFNMSLDGNRDVSDMLYIRNANGEYNVNVVDAVTVDDMYKGGLNGLRFATVGAGSKAKFRAFTYDKGALNVEYEVATDSYDNNPENDIYNGTEMSHEKPGSTVVDGLFGYEEGAVATLALNDEAVAKAADGTISETTNFKLVDRKDATPSDSGKTIIDHARANYANAVQLDTLNKRQGEMRFSQGHEDGLWARIRHDDIGKRSSFRLDNTMVEVGVDSRYVKETGEFHTGVAFDYMNGDTDYHHISGEGDLDRYGVWFYTTWLGNEGDYTDFIIKCSLIDNEYKIYAPTTGEKITGDYDNNVISVSLEHGKKYSNEESWFIEPQAQLQYAYVTSAEYTNSQGTDVRLDGIHSLIGRVGVRAGKDVTRDNPFTFYARGDIMHEFMGKQDIKAKDATGTMRVRYENDDTWYSAGLGMSYQHNKDKYYFLEAEKVFGGSNTSSYIVSGGVRFLFD